MYKNIANQKVYINIFNLRSIEPKKKYKTKIKTKARENIFRNINKNPHGKILTKNMAKSKSKQKVNKYFYICGDGCDLMMWLITVVFASLSCRRQVTI